MQKCEETPKSEHRLRRKKINKLKRVNKSNGRWCERVGRREGGVVVFLGVLVALAGGCHHPEHETSHCLAADMADTVL